MVERGPKVPLVSKPCASACRAERLARAGSGPDGVAVGPTGLPQSVRPPAEPGEKVALGVAKQIGRPDISDIPLVYVAWGDVTFLY